MKSKKGITLASLSIYLILFTIFTVFAMSVSTNMNEGLLNNRGEAINKTGLIKLQANIQDSALNSTDVTLTNGKITFSNGDIYEYSQIKSIILKNEGILCSNILGFEPSIEELTNAKKLTIELTFNKYLNNVSTQVIALVEEE